MRFSKYSVIQKTLCDSPGSISRQNTRSYLAAVSKGHLNSLVNAS
jgi:hypothetical protein